MERLTHEADFGFEDWEETLFLVKSDPNGAYNILDIAKYSGEPEFDEILKSIALRLAAYENTGLAPEEVQIQKEAMERMGWFGKMFQRYKGDPRGPIGTPGNEIAPARIRQALKDVDGNTWLPMLQEEFRAMADFRERVQDWIPVEERLPKPEENPVLAFDCTGPVMAWYSPTMGWMYRTGIAGCGITHWMHLPQPPKEETHD